MREAQEKAKKQRESDDDGPHFKLEELDGGGVIVEDVTIEIPPWDDFYGFSTNADPRAMEFPGWSGGMGGGMNAWNPSPVDATLFAGYNPLA